MKGLKYLDALAEALIIELPDLDAQDRALEEMEALNKILHEDPTLRDRLQRGATTGKSLELVEKIIKEHLDLPVAHTVLMLVREQSLTQLPKFIERLKSVRRRLNLAREVMATTSIPLTDADRKRLQKAMEKKWGLSVTLKEQVDPSVIGGILLSAGDWQMDATVRGRLHRLSESLKA